MSESTITTCSVQPRESIELHIVKETEPKNEEYDHSEDESFGEEKKYVNLRKRVHQLDLLNLHDLKNIITTEGNTEKGEIFCNEEVDIEEDSKNDEGDNEVGQDTISDHNVFKNFFWNEVNQFKEESKKDFWKDMTREDIELDFAKLFDEWRTFGRNWRLQTEVKDGEMCSELVLRILMGFLFTVLPNCMIVLDYTAAYQYLNGTDYPKLESTLKENSCENFTFTSLYWQLTNQVLGFSPTMSCFIRDPIYGVLTLTLTFIAGLFWSFNILHKFWTYLRETQAEKFKKKRMFFLFLPIALLTVASFPVQLLVISILACLNDQEQWMTLTVKVGIAEGLYNAHFQWLLQIFIFLYEADRHPSTFQLLAAFGSLLFLAYSRVESITLERGGHFMSPGQKLWWLVRYCHYCFLNCGFKLVSISLLLVMLRFNCIWLYGGVFLVWFILQNLFNEGCLPRRFYYLFQGAGIHCVREGSEEIIFLLANIKCLINSIEKLRNLSSEPSLSYTHIPDWIKLIEARKNPANNVLWVKKLSERQLHRNILFQNTIWFTFNTAILSSIWISCRHFQNHEWQLFWPFTPGNTFQWKDEKIYKLINIVVPLIISVGVLLMALVIYEEFDGLTMEREPLRVSPESLPTYPGWKHIDCSECPGDGWHKYSADKWLDDGVQGIINQVLYWSVNNWESCTDKGLH